MALHFVCHPDGNNCTNYKNVGWFSTCSSVSPPEQLEWSFVYRSPDVSEAEKRGSVFRENKRSTRNRRHEMTFSIYGVFCLARNVATFPVLQVIIAFANAWQAKKKSENVFSVPLMPNQVWLSTISRIADLCVIKLTLLTRSNFVRRWVRLLATMQILSCFSADF